MWSEVKRCLRCSHWRWDRSPVLTFPSTCIEAWREAGNFVMIAWKWSFKCARRCRFEINAFTSGLLFKNFPKMEICEIVAVVFSLVFFHLVCFLHKISRLFRFWISDAYVFIFVLNDVPEISSTSHLFFLLFRSHDPTGRVGQRRAAYIQTTIVVEQDVEQMYPMSHCDQ